MITDLLLYKGIRRNDTCPCGSGKKFKKCCMFEYQKIVKEIDIEINKKLESLKKEEIEDRIKGLKKDDILELSMEELKLIEDDLSFYEKDLNFFTVSFNFAFFSEAIFFEKMDKALLEKIPTEFTHELLELFNETPFTHKLLLSSFVRTADFIDKYDTYDEVELSDLMEKILREEKVKKEDARVIPFSSIKKYYKQKPLKKSVSLELIDTIHEAKDIGADGKMIQYKMHSHYTLWGLMSIEEKELENLKFSDIKKGREIITQKAEELSAQLSKELGFEITPIFLDFSLTLEQIIDDVNMFEKYLEKKRIYKPIEAREYSLYKRKRRFFGLF